MRVALAAGLSAFALAMAPARPAQAQYTLRVEPRLSLAWWQVNPHLNHLWATTCPAEPSWRPGEGKGIGWAQQFLTMRSKTGYAAVKDTIIPLFPRRRARPLCDEAVSGTLTASDTMSWSGVQGKIVVEAAKLRTGTEMRDRYARQSILNTAAYPTITFTIDSTSPLTPGRGNVMQGTVYGTFELHGVQRPISAPFKTWHETVGRRVTAQFMIPAQEMIDVYRMSKYSLGLGVGATVWEELWVGIDVVLNSTES